MGKNVLELPEEWLGMYGKLHCVAAGSRLFPVVKGALKGENNGWEVKQALLHGKALKSVWQLWFIKIKISNRKKCMK